ncbi:WbqC family protein [Photobacterium phosphoreum]|uniref:WbqC family protein n=1 Tax=Photobacterium phosphoreum TaxID=659 RepID=UPI000D181447|nr:WbqC family protein [Photobacterium phosphoreum]PSU32355.1 hypothetical protein CTM85_20075 [Photobacterium phosphoreum]
MKLAVMQPYLFPYIGYYQFAYCSDMFIFYDDVTYIKNGYINRNSVLTKNGRQLFTIPVKNASSFTLIKDLEFSSDIKKILATIKQTYSKAPYFSDVYPIIEKVLSSNNRNVAYIAAQSIIEFFNYLNIDFKYIYSSSLDYDRNKSAKDKLYCFCDLFRCDTYINSIGGLDLYHKSEFDEKGIDLNFIYPDEIRYKQFNKKIGFEKNLSIIDILMNLSPLEIINLLEFYNVK